MSDRVLKAGVIGAGVFGRHHARKLARAAGVELVAVYDHHGEHAEALAAEAGGEARALEAFWDGLDLVTITAPATAHAELGRAALARGLHVYMEKPLATTLADADRLIADAAKAGVVLAVGHQERAVFGAMGILDLTDRPLRIEAVRRGPRTGRNEDVSAVLDLMVHDLDLALLMTDAEPFAVEAEGDPDETSAEIAFADGLVATLTAARNAEARERRMTVTFPSGVLAVDFLARTFRNTTSFALNAGFADTPAGRDPLGASVDAFLAAVRGGTAGPMATGADALAALDLALAVEQAAGY